MPLRALFVFDAGELKVVVFGRAPLTLGWVVWGTVGAGLGVGNGFSLPTAGVVVLVLNDGYGKEAGLNGLMSSPNLTVLLVDCAICSILNYADFFC
jgi:hypothetical protein